VENGGRLEIKRIYNKLWNLWQTVPDSDFLSTDLFNEVCQEIQEITGKGVVEVWDEAGVLTAFGRDKVPFISNNPATTLNKKTGRLLNGGSMFTLVCRNATLQTTPTIFLGTGLRLRNIEKHVSDVLKKRIKTWPELNETKHNIDDVDLSRSFRPWTSKEILDNLEEDLTLTPEIKSLPSFKVALRMLHGRPRFTQNFKQNIYGMAQLHGSNYARRDEFWRRYDPSTLFKHFRFSKY